MLRIATEPVKAPSRPAPAAPEERNRFGQNSLDKDHRILARHEAVTLVACVALQVRMRRHIASSLNVRAWTRCLSKIRAAEPASLALWKSVKRHAVVLAGVRSHYEWFWRCAADRNRRATK